MRNTETHVDRSRSALARAVVVVFGGAGFINTKELSMTAQEEEANWSALLIAALKAMSDDELLARTLLAIRLFKRDKRNDRLYDEAHYCSVECKSPARREGIWQEALSLWKEEWKRGVA